MLQIYYYTSYTRYRIKALSQLLFKNFPPKGKGIPFVASNFPTRETSLNDFKRGVEVSRTLLYSPHLQFKLPIHWNFEIQLAKLVPRIAASDRPRRNSPPPRLNSRTNSTLRCYFCFVINAQRKHRLFRKRWTRYHPVLFRARTTTAFSLTRRGESIVLSWMIQSLSRDKI